MARHPRLNAHRKGSAHNVAASPGVQIPLPVIAGSNDGGQSPLNAAVTNAPVFDAKELELLAFRRFNPLKLLTAQYLESALDGFSAGLLAPAARLWWEIAERDETIGSVKRKREEAVALRDWTVVPFDDSPAAEDQAAALDRFYRQVRATHALNRHETGGFSRLATQMMESVSYGYTAHHLIWAPNATATWKLPSGRSVPTLGLTAENVPLEYFESRSGELRFLGMNQGFTGEPLDPLAWMVTAGPCLMRAASILHYYKRLATHDLVNFSEKFGAPGLVIHTTDAQGSPGGIAAMQLARSMAANYRGVMYGAPENKVEVVWPSGGTGSGNLPMTGIIEDTKRALAILYLGADLSTMSKGGQGVGASIQGDEQAKRERADCARVTETLNATLDPIVLRWYFGDGCPILAKVLIESPENEDQNGLMNRVAAFAGLGAQIPTADIAKRLNIPINPDGPKFLAPPAQAGAPLTDTAGEAVAANAAPIKAPDAPDLGKFLAHCRLDFAAAMGRDMEPFMQAITHTLGANDGQLPARLEALDRALPHFFAQIVASDRSGESLTRICGSALAIGLASGVNPPVLNPDEN